MTRARCLSALTAVLTMVVAFLVAPSASSVGTAAAVGYRDGGNCLDVPDTASTSETQLRATCNAGGGTSAGTFTNPLSQHGPDPWLTYHDGYYYLATTTWNSTITMRKAKTLGALPPPPTR
ncbi:hypothetical protein SAZ11_56920 [Streptomyces sp. FXJ1.4098]|nr:hypothetical protein [Streptomyces sp. FXJ1.4098]